MLGKSKKFHLSLSSQINLIGLLLLISFFICRQPQSKWDKVIIGDGKSYYAYLTTTFIYHDLHYDYVEDYEAKYYPPDQSLFKEFRHQVDGKVANKTFPGISILWLPFFLIAHFLSYLFGFEPDGYSILYQYAIGMAAIFYVWLGLKWLSQLLRSLEFQSKIIVPVLVGLAFGTNLFYYTIFDPSLTHVYSFTLLSGILYFTRRFYLENKKLWLLISIALFSLAIIIRPTNILMLLFLPFAIGNFNEFRSFLKLIFSDRKNLLIIFIIPIIIGAYPILWWYLQTGHPIVYSYGEEGFDFSQPHFFQILLSYEKGWLVYSPFIMLSILGLVYYFKENRFLFFVGLLGFSVIVYVFSCWWIWTYGASFGQRVFIDYYAVIAVLLAGGLKIISGSKVLFTSWIVLTFGCIGLNLLQTYQFQNGILPTINATSETYWGSYFKLKAVRQSYPVKQPFELIEVHKTDFESKPTTLTNYRTSSDFVHSGKYAHLIDVEKPYSSGLEGSIPAEADFIQVSAYLYCTSNSADPKLVFDLKNDQAKIHYQAVGLMPYLAKNEWVQFHYHISLKAFNVDKLSTYFWNPTQNKVWLDDLEIVFGKYQ